MNFDEEIKSLKQAPDWLGGKDPSKMDILVYKLLDDLKNEWTHLQFYLRAAASVQGLHCHEYKELFLEEAKKEMTHVSQFSDMLIGLGIDPSQLPKQGHDEKIVSYTQPEKLLIHALRLEQEVVENYCQRMHEAEALGSVDGDYIHIFLENQIQESREDVDHLKQILKGI